MNFKKNCLKIDKSICMQILPAAGFLSCILSLLSDLIRNNAFIFTGIVLSCISILCSIAYLTLYAFFHEKK